MAEGLVTPGGVDADGDDLAAEPVELGLLVRQPDQLAAAVWSPVTPIGDDHERSVSPAQSQWVDHLVYW
ncbi:MAG: hypothetical protein ACR2MP_15615 [Streptosporangiaceae bacterium]